MSVNLNARQPFDQFSRQYFIRRLVNEGIRKNKEKLSIIDFGGHKGNTKQAFPTDDITILDVFDVDQEGYVKGDATNTVFDDNQFDVTTSFDVFEHIPRAKRKEFIKESARVSKVGAFLTAPFNQVDKETSYVEKRANALYKEITGVDHPWLREHIEYGIPSTDEIEKIFVSQGIFFCRIPSNALDVWLLMQSLIFVSRTFDRDIKSVVDINEFYNKHLEDIEGDEKSYRQIYFFSHDKKVTEQIAGTMQNIRHSLKNNSTIKYQLTKECFSATAKMLQELSSDRQYLVEKTKLLEEEVAHAIDKKEAAETAIEKANNTFIKRVGRRSVPFGRLIGK